jgi:cytoskeletal protein CcmA (bactofilin family)
MFKGNNSKEAANPTNQINRLVEGTTVVGDILTEGNIRIDGIINGNVSIKGKLVLGINGKIEGDIRCLNADIEGTVLGNIYVDGLLILKETSKVEGKISTHKIGVLEGAEFTGTCSMNSDASHPIKEDIKLDSAEEPEMVY